MGQRNHDKSNQNESDEKIRLSMIKETASLYIGQLHLYYKAKRSGLNELIKLFTKFHSSLRLNKCGSVNTCLSTYKKVKVTQQLLNVLFSEDNDQLDTVCHVAKYLKENEQNKLDALKKIEGIPTLEEINQIALKTYTSNGYAELARRELIPFPFSSNILCEGNVLSKSFYIYFTYSS